MAIQPEFSRVKEAHKEALMAKPNVIGVGMGYKVSEGVRTEELCLVTLVRQKVPPSALQAEALVPKVIEGVRTDVIEIGEVRALQTHTSRWRPAPAGVSLGHYRITAGTFGCLVRDRATGAPLMLSNNHVLANSNDATPGDAILQPGPADGGRQGADTIAANLVDAAVARPNLSADILDEIMEIGRVAGTLPAALGMAVRKSGRTTGLTSGEITVMEATVTVSYGAGKDATFENQLIMGPMSQGGDSGSLIVAAGSLQAVGLLFAGSEQSTIANPIQAVLTCLDVTL
jgi:hypothetical protein